MNTAERHGGWCHRESAGPAALGRLVGAMISINRELELPAVLEHFLDAAMPLVDARYGAIGVLDPTRTRLVEFLTAGIDPVTATAIGAPPKGHGVLGVLIDEPKTLRLPDLGAHHDSCGFPTHHPPMRSFLGVPIEVRSEIFGNLYLTEKRSGGCFDDIDEEVTVALARAAGVVIENARLHARISELALVEDRERIAKDLHDTVIQRLFATSLSLQATAQLTERLDVAARIQDAVDALDNTVKDIRTAIFGLQSGFLQTDGFRSRALALTRELSTALGFLPEIVFDGPVDTLVTGTIGGEVLATMREALSNIARHAVARTVRVEIGAGDEIVLRISDDGRGLSDDPPAGFGLRNMASRAEALRGHFTARRRDGGGTVVEWTVPSGA